MEKVKKTRIGKLGRGDMLYGYLFVSFICIQYLIFVLVPLLMSGFYSFTDYNNISDKFQFTGFEQYAEILTDPRFLKAIGNTLLYMLHIPIVLILSFLVAYALNDKTIRCRKVFRVIYYLPAVSSALAIGIVWRWLFNSDYGVINSLLGIDAHWLTDANLIKVMINIKGIWGGLGGNMLLFLAAMQNIDDSYYEVADLEGGGTLFKMFRIAFPMCSPVLFYMLVTSVIGGMNSFADNYIIVNSADANTVVYYMYERLSEGQYGLMSAGATMLTIVVFIITFIQFKLSNKWVFEG